MTKKSTNTTTLLPLEYCRIGRAARLLGCEEGDILHWGAIGAIKLWASFDSWNGMAFVIDGERDKRTADYPTIGIDDYTLNHMSRYTLTEERGSDICVGQLSGFWALTSGCLDTMERHQVAPENLWFLVKDLNGNKVWAVIDSDLRAIRDESVDEDDEGEAFMSKIKHNNKNLSNRLSDSVVGDLWIMREDLNLAHQHIHAGTPFARNPDNDDKPAQTQIHPTAERFAVTREKVFAAAICAKERWPEDCGSTARDWANVIENHSANLFGGANNAPLSVEVMERLLGAAMSTGEVRKNT